MAATVEHVRCLGLEGCQEVPQASQRHRTFSWLHPRTHTRHSVGWGACDTVSFSVTQMPFVIVCVVEERKEKPRDFRDAGRPDPDCYLPTHRATPTAAHAAETK